MRTDHLLYMGHIYGRFHLKIVGQGQGEDNLEFRVKGSVKSISWVGGGGPTGIHIWVESGIYGSTSGWNLEYVHWNGLSQKLRIQGRFKWHKIYLG